MTDTSYSLIEAGSLLVPDSVAQPDVIFTETGARIDYYRRDGGWARVVFERWDSLRVCRGEWPPYPQADDEVRSGIDIVRPSTWLAERHGYEAKHYRNNYDFDNDVDEMLREFEHYLFHFHDVFVEVIAGGLHFDLTDGAPAANGSLTTRPGWLVLPESATRECWQCSGIACHVRVDPRPHDEIREAARFCSQRVVDLALELDGHPSVSHGLTVRTRDGVTRSRWRGYFGAVEQTFEGIPPLDAIRPLVEAYAATVRQARDARK